MQDPIPAQANIVTMDLVARADGSPITAGTVNLYVIANTGDNAGKWFDGSDNSWSAIEVAADAANMTHLSDGHWQVSVDAACWIDGVEYTIYAKEDGGLHTPVSQDVRCHYQLSVTSAGKATGVVTTDVCTLNTTTTTNSDMVGTNGAYTGTPPTATAIVDEWESQSQTDPTGFHVNILEMKGDAQSITDLKDLADAGYDPVAHKVQGVALVDTTTANTDMVGTDGANTTTPPTAAANADAVWDEAIAGHAGVGTFGAKNQKIVPSESAADYKADVAALALEATLDTAQADLTTLLSRITAAVATAAALTTAQAAITAIKGKTDNLPASPANNDTVAKDATVAKVAALTTAQGNITSILQDTGTTIPALIAALNDPTTAAIATGVLEKVLVDHKATAGSLADALWFLWQYQKGTRAVVKDDPHYQQVHYDTDDNAINTKNCLGANGLDADPSTTPIAKEDFVS